MCIIVAKNKDVNNLPDTKYLKNCFDNNSDGAGFMYVDHGAVIIDKGYMDYDKFLSHYEELCKKYNNFKNKALVMHFRIGTSSANSPQNTHPYPITYKEKELHKTYISTTLGIVHNGIIGDYTPSKNATINDTQNFIINYIYPLYKNYPKFYENAHIMKGIGKITNSKFIMLDTNENIYKIGEFKICEKILYSNDTYEYSWYNDYMSNQYYYPSRYAYEDELLPENEYLPSDTTVILSDGTEIKVGDVKLKITWEGDLYEFHEGKPSLIDTDCYAMNPWGELIYNDWDYNTSKL